MSPSTWWDNNWISSVYSEVENHGLVTPTGNAYDGVQDVTGSVDDQYGFLAGGEAANLEDIFIRIIQDIQPDRILHSDKIRYFHCISSRSEHSFLQRWKRPDDKG